MRERIVAGFLLLILVLPMTAMADSWLPPKTQHYESPDGQWRLTVDPRPLSSQLAYFSDKVDGKAQAGSEPGDTQVSAIGTMAHKVKGKWQRVWRKPLRNDVAPVEAVVLNGGAFMTLDNWHSVGPGPDAVVLYNRDGTATAQFALRDFLPGYYVMALPHSVSSMDWRREARAQPDGRTIAVQVLIPNEDDDSFDEANSAHIDIVFEPVSGTFAHPAGPAWEQAKAAAQRVRAVQRREEEDAQRKFVAPLLGPADNSERSWHLYLMGAFFRIDPRSEDDYPKTIVLRSPEAKDYQASEVWLHDALLKDEITGALMIASISQDDLVSRLAIETRQMKPGHLSNARIYLALNDAHFALGKQVLKASGATVIQLNPSVGIPQNPDRLAKAQEAWEAAKVEEASDELSR